MANVKLRFPKKKLTREDKFLLLKQSEYLIQKHKLAQNPLRVRCATNLTIPDDLPENAHPVNAESRRILESFGVVPDKTRVHCLELFRDLWNGGLVPINPKHVDIMEALLEELELADPSEVMEFLDLNNAPDGEGV